MMSLVGAFDLHIHTSPDLSPRCVDDLDAARQATAVGMGGILLKSHYGSTAARATIAEKVVPSVRVFGSLVLNKAVGGLNPAAAEAALRLGAREIFLPTISSANHRKNQQLRGGICITTKSARSALLDILSLVKEHHAIVGTGHLSKKEIVVLVRAALHVGIPRIMITHPEHPFVNLSLSEQASLAETGVFFERCFASTLPKIGDVPLDRIANEIRGVGAKNTVLTSDLGRADCPSPVEGFEFFLNQLLDLGISETEIGAMIKSNPSRLLE